MAAEKFANNARSTLASGITSGATSLTLQAGDGAKFPSAGNFRIIVDDEIMIVGARSSDTLSSITRAAESTTAIAHSAAAPVTHIVTKGALETLVQGAVALVTAGAIPFITAAGELISAATKFFWDSVNNRLGIGTDAPACPIHVVDPASASEGLRLEAQGSASPNIKFQWKLSGLANAPRFEWQIHAPGGAGFQFQRLNYVDDAPTAIISIIDMDKDGHVGIHAALNSRAVARLSVYEATLGARILRLFSAATNDDPMVDVFQNRVTTTNATVTTLHTVAIPASKTVTLIAYINARRTGGAAGTAEDGWGYGIVGTFKNVAGVATQIGATTPLYTHESQAAFAVAYTPSGGNVLIEVTGAVDNDVVWHLSKLEYMEVGT